MAAVLVLFGVWFLINIAVITVLIIRTLPPRELRRSFSIHRMQYAPIRRGLLHTTGNRR